MKTVCVSFSFPLIDLCHISRNVRPLLFLFFTAKTHIDKHMLRIRCYSTNGKNFLDPKNKNLKASTCVSLNTAPVRWVTTLPGFGHQASSHDHGCVIFILLSSLTPRLVRCLTSCLHLFKYIKIPSMSNIANMWH